LESGIAHHTILLTALLDVANSFSSTVDNLPHISHTEVSIVDEFSSTDTSAQQTGTGVSTHGVAGWHLWHGHVSLLTCSSLVSLNTLVTSHQTGEVGGNIAFYRLVGLVGLIASAIGLVSIGLVSIGLIAVGLVGLVASAIGFVTIRFVAIRFVTIRFVTIRFVTIGLITIRFVTVGFVTIRFVTIGLVTIGLIASTISRLVGLISTISTILRLLRLLTITTTRWPLGRSCNAEESEDQKYRNSDHGYR